MLKMIPLIFMFGSAIADAKPPPPVRSTVTVTIGWTWVPGHWTRGVYTRAHWRHPAHGVHHRAYRHGPPTVFSPPPHTHSEWVPGHWKGHGRTRHWVPGHWRHKPPPNRK